MTSEVGDNNRLLEAATVPGEDAVEGAPVARPSVRYVDTHAHLDEPAFAGDLEDVVARAHASGVDRAVNIGYRPERWTTTADLAARFPPISVVLGLHPQQATEFTDRTCAELEVAIRRAGARAVGEIGLDYARDFATPDQQRRAFAAQLELAQGLGLPVVLHQRAAEQDCWDMLRAAPPALPVLLHCFDGSRLLARLALDRGYHFGIGGLLTRSAAADLRAVVAELPLERLVLETDAPYLTPAGLKNRRNEPANIPRIAAALADLLERTVDDVAQQTTANAERVFALPPPLRAPRAAAAAGPDSTR
jgi:TatD DNase family protein